MQIDLNKPNGAKKIANFYEGKIEGAMKTAVVECLRNVIIATPVDTGRARFSWLASKSSIPTELPPKGEYPNAPVVERLQIIKEVNVKDTLYIANNVPYVVNLNNGSSKQAPARFVERSAEAGQRAGIAYLKSK